MRPRVALVVLVATAVFAGSYAVGRADRPSERADADAPVTGERAPTSRRVPLPAAARLPSLRRETAAPTSAASPPAPRRTIDQAAPPPAPRASPSPEPGTPFFDEE